MSGTDSRHAIILVLMGVAGCGKSTVGRQLAIRLGWAFIDADDFHSKENVHKMACGIPLTDKERLPWLNSIHSHIYSTIQNNQNAVYACSALKKEYRERLKGNLQNLNFVYLEGSFEVLLKRLQDRNHFAGPSLLPSQFRDLEEPENAIILNCEEDVQKLVTKLVLEVSKM